jgi:hypothetical protein
MILTPAISIEENCIPERTLEWSEMTSFFNQLPHHPFTGGQYRESHVT